jgi:hypothetical protein
MVPDGAVAAWFDLYVGGLSSPASQPRMFEVMGSLDTTVV